MGGAALEECGGVASEEAVFDAGQGGADECDRPPFAAGYMLEDAPKLPDLVDVSGLELVNGDEQPGAVPVELVAKGGQRRTQVRGRLVCALAFYGHPDAGGMQARDPPAGLIIARCAEQSCGSGGDADGQPCWKCRIRNRQPALGPGLLFDRFEHHRFAGAPCTDEQRRIVGVGGTSVKGVLDRFEDVISTC